MSGGETGIERLALRCRGDGHIGLCPLSAETAISHSVHLDLSDFPALKNYGKETQQKC